MTAIASVGGGLFSVITTGNAPAQSLRALLGLPARGDAHVDYSADTRAQRNRWAVRLDDAVLHAEKPVLLVASGISCHAAAWWARLSPGDYISRVAGALLFDPLGRDDGDPGQFAAPRMALPFPSIVLSGERGHREAAGHIQALADVWGSGLANLSAHRAGTGWQAAHDVVLRITTRIIERRMRVADALGIADTPEMRH